MVRWNHVETESEGETDREKERAKDKEKRKRETDLQTNRQTLAEDFRVFYLLNDVVS